MRRIKENLPEETREGYDPLLIFPLQSEHYRSLQVSYATNSEVQTRLNKFEICFLVSTAVRRTCCVTAFGTSAINLISGNEI